MGTDPEHADHEWNGRLHEILVRLQVHRVDEVAASRVHAEPVPSSLFVVAAAPLLTPLVLLLAHLLAIPVHRWPLLAATATVPVPLVALARELVEVWPVGPMQNEKIVLFLDAEALVTFVFLFLVFCPIFLFEIFLNSHRKSNQHNK